MGISLISGGGSYEHVCVFLGLASLNTKCLVGRCICLSFWPWVPSAVGGVKKWMKGQFVWLILDMRLTTSRKCWFVFVGCGVRQQWPAEMETSMQKTLAMGQRDPAPQQQPLCLCSQTALEPHIWLKGSYLKDICFAHASWKKRRPKRNLSHASTEERMQTELSHPRRPVMPIGNTETLHPGCSSVSTSKPNHPWTEI